MISPAQEAFLESLSTLKFANRAKNIKNEAKINEDLDEKALLRRYERELKKLRQELQAKSKNVVDKRKLIEVEEQRRRAEQDKMTALMNMERLSRDLLTEKNQKKKLEERIKEMNSQLLVGGLHGAANTGAGASGDPSAQVESQKAFQQALQLEQDRIRAQYSEKLQELEKEREQMEEEKAQTSRYKQLLLKQRDIMIQLTARLNERDQSILLLQEELDAYDKHQRAMEDELDQKRHRLIQLQRMNVGSGGSGPMAGLGPDGSIIPTEPSSPTSSTTPTSGAQQQSHNLYGLFPIDEAPYFEEHSLSPLQSPGSGGGSGGGGRRSDASSPLDSPSRASGGGSASPPNGVGANGPIQLDALTEDRIANEVESRLASEWARREAAIQSQASQQVSELNDALRAKESETLRLREELDRLRRQPPSSTGASSPEIAQLTATLKTQDEYAASLVAQNATLQQNLATLQARLASTTAEHQSDEKQTRESLASLKKKYDVQLQERAALKVILEKKMKALIDSIASAAIGSKSAGPNGSPAKDSGSSLPSRTKREIEVLQRLVEASLTALKNSEVEGTNVTPATTATTSIQPTPSPLPSMPPTHANSSSAPPLSRSYGAPSPMTHIPSSSSSTIGAGASHSSGLSSMMRPLGSPSPPSSHHSTSSASQSQSASSNLNEIELLIQQRKAELMRMDERLR